MKILKLLNKKYFSIILILLLGLSSYAEEQPIDIWNIDKKKIDEESLKDNAENSIEEIEIKDNSNSSVYNMQSQKEVSLINLEEKLDTKEIKIIGLYDPKNYGLDINMWSNSEGDQLKILFNKLNKMNLSNDAAEIMNISVLTNAYYPQKNISEKEFLKLKSDWLIKNSNLELIEEYLIQNQIINLHPELTKFLVDQYLSSTNIKKACEIFLKNKEPITDEYLSKFNIFCLIKNNKREEAQLILDLKKELGFDDKYFEEKINYLLEYTTEVSNVISEKSIFDFYLAHQTNLNFAFEPNDKTNKIIWKYLSSANLLNFFQEIDVSEIEKISTIEKAVHNKNYPEKDLFELYKRFQFNINQLLNVKDSYKLLQNYEGRALLYQRLILTQDINQLLDLSYKLKDSFIKDNIENAFNIELKKILNNIDEEDVPSNYSSFYVDNLTTPVLEKKNMQETEVAKTLLYSF